MNNVTRTQCAHRASACGGSQGRSIVSRGRRNLLLGAGTALAATLLPGGRLLAQGAGATLIDTHHHFYAPAYQKAWSDWEDRRSIAHSPTQFAWTRERSLEGMDRAGIRCAMLSIPSTPGLWFDLAADQVERMVRTCNDYGAQMVRDYPGRFGLFATLSMLDIEATLHEIAYVFDVLKADGIGLQSNYGDKWLGDAKYKPIWEELDRRGALVYVHPLVASCCSNLSVGTFPSVIEVPHDTTRAVTSLLLTGTLALHRKIRWLFSHAGGTIPMMAGRIDSFYGRRPNLKDFAPDGIFGELRRLHYDTANATGVPTIAALLGLVPSTQVTFGTDYPYFALDQFETLGQRGLSPQDLEAIGSGNAIRLLPRLAV